MPYQNIPDRASDPPDKPEPVLYNKAKCFCCGEIYEATNFQCYRNDETGQEVVICEDCQNCTKWQTAWND